MLVFKFLKGTAASVIIIGVVFSMLGFAGSIAQFVEEMNLLLSPEEGIALEGAVLRAPPIEERSSLQGYFEPIATNEPEIEENIAFIPLLSNGDSAQGLPVTGTNTNTEGPEASPTPYPTPTPRPVVAPDRIVIPGIGLDASIDIVPQLELQLGEDVFTHWMAPDYYAAGWHQGSSFLGEPGNTVLSGHNDIFGGVFGNISDLKQGDELFVSSEGHTYRYVVAQVMRFEERYATLDQRLDNARWIMPSDDERVTLVSCWPPRSNTHRVIVVAAPAD
jgi:LPXTG-site transpeptidase (sortase) family protein